MDRRTIVGCISGCLLAGWAVAADSVVEHGPFSVDSVTLTSLRGSLTVNVVEGTAVRLRVAGDAAAVAALDVAATAGTLDVSAPTGGASVIVGSNVTVVIGPGAESRVTIGGADVPAAATSPLDVVLEMPAGTSLTVDGFAGEAVIGDLRADIVLRLVDGHAALGAVAGAELAAIGAAAIDAASVTGDLAASVTGEGRIGVAAGAIGTARLAVTGAGTLAVDAPISRAEVTMVGAGSVRLAKVASPPSVSSVGSGTFRVGPS